MSKTIYGEFEILHDLCVKIFNDFIEVYGIKKVAIKILDWILKIKRKDNQYPIK